MAELFASPEHPYTDGLLGAIPSVTSPRPRLAAIEGRVPAATDWPTGCRFAPRCPFADERCRREPPAMREVGPDHRSRCWKAPLETLVLPGVEVAATVEEAAA